MPVRRRLPVEVERQALDLARVNRALQSHVEVPFVPGCGAGSALQLIFAKDAKRPEDPSQPARLGLDHRDAVSVGVGRAAAPPRPAGLPLCLEVSYRFHHAPFAGDASAERPADAGTAVGEALRRVAVTGPA
jgi:hypothetical protein